VGRRARPGLPRGCGSPPKRQKIPSKKTIFAPPRG